jgi:hypothetical protein
MSRPTDLSDLVGRNVVVHWAAGDRPALRGELGHMEDQAGPVGQERTPLWLRIDRSSRPPVFVNWSAVAMVVGA